VCLPRSANTWLGVPVGVKRPKIGIRLCTENAARAPDRACVPTRRQ
jgi:hypothetical protein